MPVSVDRLMLQFVSKTKVLTVLAVDYKVM